MNDVLRRMSIEQQIGQLLMAGFPGETPTPEILRLIESAHVGNIILFSRNLSTAQQTRDLIAALQAAARGSGHPCPLLIATDQENGIVQRMGAGTTAFPGNMALGAIGSEEAAEAVARATGDELRALGITMNLAPVVDIANNPENPVIGVRSFGADPELVARLGAAATRGYRAAGVAATLKH
ncbi:MAG TPA: glycoside hydrolase family 3 N-terminal domain-containing protein, partial [Ktedonobacterales bacterium]